MRISLSQLRHLIAFFIIYSSFSIIHGQGISTISEIYDYDIGDQFHYNAWAQDGNNGFYSYTNIIILDKFYSTDSNTIFYVRDCSEYFSGSSGRGEFSYYIDTLSVTSLNSLINSGWIDTVYSNPALYNGREINYLEWTSLENHYETKFINGCGGPYIYHKVYEPPFADWDEENKLIYYLKGDEEWGTPFFVTTKELTNNQNAVKIFPNPASEFIFIVMNSKPSQKLEGIIYSNIGTKAKSFFINDDKTQINISDLGSGIYFIYISSDKVIYRGKFIRN